VTEAGGGGTTDQSGVGLLLGFASKVLAPAGVITAVLYYFGFLREQALFARFGVDLGSVGFSTTDYLVRSAGTLFVPLIVVLLGAVAAVLAHHTLDYVTTRLTPERRRVVSLGLVAVAVLLLVAGVVGVQQRGDPAVGSLAGPVALGGGAILLQYAVDNAGPGTMPAGVSSALTGTRTVRHAATVALVLVSIFWATANLAQRRGVEAAKAIEKSLPVQAQAVVYSKERLQITGRGVEVATLDPSDARYRYRYNGLRMLLHSGDRWFLLPVGWTSESGDTVVLLPDDSPDIRVDLAP
jgi:uncharacterized membrane protein YidH (DUF202 family)